MNRSQYRKTVAFAYPTCITTVKLSSPRNFVQDLVPSALCAPDSRPFVWCAKGESGRSGVDRGTPRSGRRDGRDDHLGRKRDGAGQSLRFKSRQILQPFLIDDAVVFPVRCLRSKSCCDSNTNIPLTGFFCVLVRTGALTCHRMRTSAQTRDSRRHCHTTFRLTWR